MAKEKYVASVGDDQDKLKTGEYVYADRLINFHIGFGVSKLTFGTHMSPKSIKPVQTLVIPTKQLIQAIKFILDQVQENGELKENLIEDSHEFISLINGHDIDDNVGEFELDKQ